MKSKDFFDEQILDMINQAEKNSLDDISMVNQVTDGVNEKKESEDRSIYSGVRICGKWVYFERRIIEENMISMMIPKDFIPMTKEAMKIKYPSEHRPGIILTDETGTVNILFQYMEGESDSSNIVNLRNQVFGLMKYANPGIREREVGEIDASGQHIAYVEFTNNALGGKLYNLMFYISVKGRPLMGSFNCTTKDMKYWQPVAMEMMQSIKVEETR